jgi:hypothetical protein
MLVLVGCGGSSGPTTSSFKAEFKVQKAKLHTLGDEIGSAVEDAGNQTDAALAKQFEGLASSATSLAGALGQLNPPSKFKDELASLQSSVTQVAGTLHSIEAAAAANDAASAKAGGEAIVADAKQVKSLDETLSKKLGLPAE